MAGQKKKIISIKTFQAELVNVLTELGTPLWIKRVYLLHLNRFSQRITIKSTAGRQKTHSTFHVHQKVT